MRLRDFLFPRKSCTTAFKTPPGLPKVSVQYELGVDGQGRETIKETRKGAEPHTYDWVVGKDGIRSEAMTYPAEARKLDLLTRRQRIIEIADQAPAPRGALGPCLTVLSRQDKDRIIRTYETWCRGVGLARTDESRGRARVIYEIEATTCR